MNIHNGKIFFVAFVFISMVKFNLILAEENSSDQKSDNQVMIGTFRSPVEYIIEKIDSGLKNSSHNSFIGKTFSDVLDTFAERIKLIFPGTYWCGDGNIASNASDLGVFDKTDNCCRNHDDCSDNIESNESKGDLINNGIFTRSSCACDHAFYKCLKDAHTVVASGIGDTYFNILRPQCFEKNYPIKSCVKHDRIRFSEKKCTKYDLDTTKEQVLEWFDNPDF